MDEVYFNQASGFRLGSRSKESNFRAYITEGRGQKLPLSHLMFFFWKFVIPVPQKTPTYFLTVGFWTVFQWDVVWYNFFKILQVFLNNQYPFCELSFVFFKDFSDCSRQTSQTFYYFLDYQLTPVEAEVPNIYYIQLTKKLCGIET